jgi:hypothetical protein
VDVEPVEAAGVDDEEGVVEPDGVDVVVLGVDVVVLVVLELDVDGVEVLPELEPHVEDSLLDGVEELLVEELDEDPVLDELPQELSVDVEEEP